MVQAGFGSGAWGTVVGGHVGTGTGVEMISGRGSSGCQGPEVEAPGGQTQQEGGVRAMRGRPGSGASGRHWGFILSDRAPLEGLIRR